MTMDVAVLDDFQRVAHEFGDWASLGSRARVTVFHDHLHDREAVVQRLAGFDAVCLMRERTGLDAWQLGRLPRLKFIALAATRHAGLDLDCARARGIVVSGTAATHNGTPELTWALILALARQLPQQAASVRAGGWQCDVGIGLHGATLGILGLGRVGGKVARVARAFDMNVIAWSPNLNDARAAEHGVVRVERDALFSQSDFLVVSIQLRAATRGLVGRRELALMKPGAFVVNTSRGAVIDDEALIDALRGQRLAGAGLDVFDVEPLPAGHPYRTLPNVLATPHIGYVTRDVYQLFHQGMVDAVRAWLDGRPIRLLTEQVMGA